MEPIYLDSNSNDPNTSRTLLQTVARMTYVHPDTNIASLKRDETGSDEEMQNVIWQPTNVWVENGRLRPTADCCRLHTHGFQLVTDAARWNGVDFLSRDSVIDHYYPHCENLLRTVLGPGVTMVRAFDHNIRLQKQQQQSPPPKPEQQEPSPKSSDPTKVAKTHEPINLVHGDYTTTSAPRRLELLAQAPKVNDVWRERLGETSLLDPKMVQDCLQGQRRYAFVNLWRNIDRQHAVQAFPLACLDATTHAAGDLRLLQLYYPDRMGENYLCCPAPGHTWVYFPEMTFDEVLLLKQWDSYGDFAKNNKDAASTSAVSVTRDELSTFTIHSAFADPVSSPEAPPRQSIEVRCVVMWDLKSE